MLERWLAMEHYRLHSVEEWPEGPRKEAVLAAVRSSLASLMHDPRALRLPQHCLVCAARARQQALLPSAKAAA